MSQAAIIAAINDRKVITFVYKGKVRTVEPLIIGYDTSGDQLLSAWQISGGSSVGFRYFRVGTLRELATTGQTFAGAPRLQSK